MKEDATFHPEVIDFDAHLDCYWCTLVFKTRAKLIAHYNKAHREIRAGTGKPST